MGILEDRGGSLSWGAVDDYKNIQAQANSGVSGAIGDTATQTTGWGPWQKTSPIGAIDALFTATADGITDRAGINYDAIETIMIPALEAYIARVETEINGLTNAKDRRQIAIKDEEDLGPAIDAFIDAVKDHLLDVTSHLRKFAGRLSDVGANYKTTTANLGADVKTQASTIENAVDRFAE